TKCGAPPTAAERKWALPTVARGLGGVAPIGDGNCESNFLAYKIYFIEISFRPVGATQAA
ncbi:MAG: hypothetical protein FWF81_06390, partial [Defluviitaleaceae bacterium]|nr:hypothetical protein [Defluviitaleaceae bacterium]